MHLMGHRPHICDIVDHWAANKQEKLRGKKQVLYDWPIPVSTLREPSK